MASTAPPSKSDAQKSRDASEPLFTKKKSSMGKERKRREPLPPSNEDDSSNGEEEDGSSSEDADGYDRDRHQYNEDCRRWQENAHRTPPGDGGGDDRRSRPEEVEEELVKEREEDHRRHRPEVTESSLVVNIDRRVSLMVLYREPLLLKCFPLWLNVSKNRRDRLLQRSPHSKIPSKSIPALKPI